VTEGRQLLRAVAVDRGPVGVGIGAGAKALDPRILVERPSATHGVTEPVTEGADPRAA